MPSFSAEHVSHGWPRLAGPSSTMRSTRSGRSRAQADRRPSYASELPHRARGRDAFEAEEITPRATATNATVRQAKDGAQTRSVQELALPCLHGSLVSVSEVGI
jgi:hypothetical protein